MLDELRARNIGLIADAVLTPGQGLTVITGETGAGKTLMLGALRLVRGDKASKSTVGPHGDVTEVAARLVEDNNEETVVRRVVTDGRSRAYLNGSPASAKELAAFVGTSINIVGQHDQHTLATSEGIRTMIDAMLTSDEIPLLAAYEDAYGALQEIEAEMELLGSDTRGLERELEMTRFQFTEIDEAGFVVGEEEQLRSRLDRLRHAEEITEELARATTALGETGTEGAFGEALAALERIVRLDEGAGELAVRLSEIVAVSSELSAEVAQYATSVESDPAELASDELRLAELAALKRKYGDTISDILAFAKAALERSETIVSLLDAAGSLEARHTAAIASLGDASRMLRSVRVEHAGIAEQTAQSHLRDLGFGSPVVRIEVDAKQPTSKGADRFKVLFASDEGLTPSPISSVASGGELSRLVLALTLASGGADVDVVAFDEIDAGIGGTTALAMGEKLAALGHTRQVICVTHLPQVAAFGSHHYTVTRVGTTATIEQITGQRRVEEISRMLAGMEDSDRGQRHAEELLGMAKGAPQRGNT